MRNKASIIKLGAFVTPERKRKGDIILDIRGANKSGTDEESTIQVAGERSDTPNGILDILYRDGTLGKHSKQRTQRRFDVAVWFRTLYLRTHNSSVIGSYSDGGGGSKELKRAKAWNLECMKDTMRMLRNSGPYMIAVCVEGARPHENQVRRFREALDRLAAHRDVAGGRDKEITERVNKDFGLDAG